MREGTFYLAQLRSRHHSSEHLHPIIDIMSCTLAEPWRTLAAISALLLFSIVCVAGKHFVMPTAQPAKSYPAHDEHPTEAITLALDPYDMADKASVFSVRYNDVGMLPILVVITNDGDQPV